MSNKVIYALKKIPSTKLHSLYLITHQFAQHSHAPTFRLYIQSNTTQNDKLKVEGGSEERRQKHTNIPKLENTKLETLKTEKVLITIDYMVFQLSGVNIVAVGLGTRINIPGLRMMSRNIITMGCILHKTEEELFQYLEKLVKVVCQPPSIKI